MTELEKNNNLFGKGIEKEISQEKLSELVYELTLHHDNYTMMSVLHNFAKNEVTRW